jgi:hypothetical protein
MMMMMIVMMTTTTTTKMVIMIMMMRVVLLVVSKECTQSCSKKLSAAVSASKTQLTDTQPQQTPNLLMINDVGAPSPYRRFQQHWHK